MNKRLPQQPGEWIDRGRELEFRFEGTAYRGFQGDSLSSALWANGVRVLGRSFKYHRPRGIYSLAGHDANVLLEGNGRTNLRGDLEPLQADLDLRAVNTKGSVRWDWLNTTERFSRFLPVGFYYKAFHTPRWLFPFYEKQMRKVAGLGTVDPQRRSAVSPKDYASCDLLIVGAGPAGLSAAVKAGRLGLRVMVVDEQPRPGGSFTWQHAADPDSQDRLAGLLEACRQLDNVEMRCGTQAGGWYADHWIALFDDRRMTKLRARATLIAAGCIEQPAVFQNNDLPGVMMASAAQRLIHLYAVKPLEQAVVVAANRDGYQAALDLANAGVRTPVLVDPRPHGETTAIAERVRESGIDVRVGQMVYEAIPRSGKRGIRAARICRLDAEGRPTAESMQTVPCDGIVCGVGWLPQSGLVYQAGGKFQYSDSLHQFVPASLPPSVFVAGRGNGVFALQDQLSDGECAAERAARFLRGEEDPDSRMEPPMRESQPQSHPYPIVSHKKKKNFVDLDEDLHLADLSNAWQEGYDNIELMKRFTTVGMGPSQGKLSNMNAIRVLARLNQSTIDQTGSTTSRPFHRPVPLGQLAGRGFHPMRRTALHGWHVSAGAEMVHAGTWYRPEYYRVDGKSRDDCIIDEAQQVRRRVGLIDVSTLGKIQIGGPDADRFLEFIYSGSFAKQPVGRLRYGVACDESGVVIEDGVVARLEPRRFYVSATSSGAAAFYREMQRWAMLEGFDVTLANLTGHLAAFNLAGPLARGVLQRLTKLDLSADAFPFLSCREAEVAGAPALLMRVGFVGELAYEIHVPVAYARQVWQAAFAAGADSIAPFGVEAQRLLRLEKGHLIVGHDTDALTNMKEADVEWTIGKKKKPFVGSRSLRILKEQPLTRKLAGLRFATGFDGPFPEECHLIITDGEITGRITSIAPRSTVGCALAMCFVRPDLATPGTKVQIRVADGTLVDAEVVSLPFYDPEGQRQRLDSAADSEGPQTEVPQTEVPQTVDVSALRQSPLADWKAAPSLEWTESAGAQVALRWSSPEVERSHLDCVSLSDWSALAKLGVKGDRSVEWLQQHGVIVPDEIYLSSRLPDGGLAVRLGRDEFYLEDALRGGLVNQWTTGFSRSPEQAFGFARNDATFQLRGPRATEVLAQTCSIDFPNVQPGRAVMTRLAGCNAMILATDGHAGGSFHINTDAGLAEYLWQCLLTICEELGGGAVGMEVLDSH